MQATVKRAIFSMLVKIIVSAFPKDDVYNPDRKPDTFRTQSLDIKEARDEFGRKSSIDDEFGALS